MHSGYHTATMRQLRDQQVRYAPREKKIEQVERAEQLLRELEPARTYTYEYLCYRLTAFRPAQAPHVTMSGADVLHDLRLFVEDVSDSANIRVEEVGEPVHTLDEVSRMFNVSTKTVSRWRQQGLVSRRFLFNGRKRVGFLHSSIERFVANNRERVRRGERFSQLTDEDRHEIIERARRMARAGGCPSEVIRRIAKQMGRSVETIRYTLKQFDEKHPDLAVFPDATGPLSPDAKRNIYQQYRRGVSAEALAKRYSRSKAAIYRVINEMRARRILELPLEYIDNPIFHRPGVERQILAPMPEPETPTRRSKAPAGLPPYLASLYEVPLLTREQEYHLFRKFNYLKYKANRLRQQLDPAQARSSVMDKIERLYEEAVETKNRIVKANLRLVVSIAKRHVPSGQDFFQLVSDGNMSLIRAVEKFDFARGNKFSTYASWAIMKNFARTIPEEFKHQDRFRPSPQEIFAETRDERPDVYEQEAAQQLRVEDVGKLLSHLDGREQKIIMLRFGLQPGQEPQTLKQVGEQLGVTKERVRQIEARALNKLRLAAQQEKVESPD